MILTSAIFFWKHAGQFWGFLSKSLKCCTQNWRDKKDSLCLASSLIDIFFSGQVGRNQRRFFFFNSEFLTVEQFSLWCYFFLAQLFWGIIGAYKIPFLGDFWCLSNTSQKWGSFFFQFFLVITSCCWTASFDKRGKKCLKRFWEDRLEKEKGVQRYERRSQKRHFLGRCSCSLDIEITSRDVISTWS